MIRPIVRDVNCMADGRSGLSIEERHELTQLMIRYANGERSAFEQVFQILWPQVLVLTRHMLRNQADAEDAAQGALLKVFSRIVDFDGTRDGLAWALGIAAFEARTILQKSRLRREDFVDAPEQLQGVQASAEEALMVRDSQLVLASVIGSLSPDDRLTITTLLQVPDSRPGPLSPADRKRKQRVIERIRAAWLRFPRG